MEMRLHFTHKYLGLAILTEVSFVLISKQFILTYASFQDIFVMWGTLYYIFYLFVSLTCLLVTSSPNSSLIEDPIFMLVSTMYIPVVLTLYISGIQIDISRNSVSVFVLITSPQRKLLV